MPAPTTPYTFAPLTLTALSALGVGKASDLSALVARIAAAEDAIDNGAITPAPTLNALTVSPATATQGTTYSGVISGQTNGSTLSLSGAGAAGLTLNGTTISGTPTASGAVNVVEGLAGATNTPRTSSNVIAVAAAGPGYTRYVLQHNRSNDPNQQGGTNAYALLDELIAYNGANGVFSLSGATVQMIGAGVNDGHEGAKAIDGNYATNAQFDYTATTAPVYYLITLPTAQRWAKVGLVSHQDFTLMPGAFVIKALESGDNQTGGITLFTRTGAGDTGNNPVGYVNDTPKIFDLTYPNGK